MEELSFSMATERDFDTLQQIYRYTVQKLAPSLYSPAQVEAWSAAPNNFNCFQYFIFDPDTYLLSIKQQIVGFCGLRKNGHIASLYIHPDYTRQGYGTKLLNYVLNIGINRQIKRFFTEASFFSYPVFTRCGFTVIEMETVNYGDVAFDRYKMEKIIPYTSDS
ncbi:GNAT family N-acetyltransferase [Cyanobacterium aponinum UTEX 3222]|uniref:GNAT family N-acetyltransferase n=1 Tax=Cyanobacterium aponinum AL20115 TaxID=3090662 RepID=A0AAF1C2D9_9CHRO|nr:GNAT family N-acetyltransferase [Cyanobacterium aponinum]WPF88583.1 GNAT family N-acetyltransferase [Cyanobacterium aponinum AL20115]WRL39724.1 GNAT family N-acetyltransferase [Cyanobacterium aponinum UTEX 3221]WRL42562.1 GNAT family N-acetyltransferase [Cyanobacterium aponinum UTEX 3222]